jgi:ceramide glucosyltransferase
MTTLLAAAGLFCLAALLIHGLTVAAVLLRQRQPTPGPRPGVSIVRPVCGIENHIEETLASAFRLAYPHYEVLLCVASSRDPVIPLVQRLIAAHQDVPARLLIGDERVSDNPKLNNVVKGWRAAAHDWIILADSNVLMPPDYIDRLLAAWRPDTGLVAAPPIGSQPDGFWGELECGFLNTYQARWQYSADALGFGFAQGKTMLWRRADIDRAGGLRALGREAAEDAAATKLVRAAGLRVRLADQPFPQPLGARRFAEVWRRQVRWARLRRASFPVCYAPELVSSASLPLIAAAIAAFAVGLSPLVGALLLASLWYGLEALLAGRMNWHLTVWSPLAWLVRDLMLPALWLMGWFGSGFVWRGNAMRAAAGRTP